MTRIISVVSCKGGVGKTTLSINLATALTNLGMDTVLLDGDLRAPNIAIHLGASGMKNTIHDVISGKSSIKESIHIHRPSGLRLIPASHSLKSARNSDFDVFTWLQGNMSNLAETIIVDTPPGLNNDSLEVIRMSDGVIGITTPDMPSIIDTMKSLMMAKKLGKQILGVVINKAGNFDMNVTDIEALLETSILAVIPEEDDVKESLYIKHPVVYSHPESAFSKNVVDIASRITQKW